MTVRWPGTRITRAWFFAALLGALGAADAAAETLKVGGTGAALGTLHLLAAEFSRQNPAIKVEVLPYIGSTGAIKSVAAGTLDLGLSGRPAKPAEEKLDAVLSRYALTPLIIAIHPANPLNSISRDRLAAIYSGQSTHWEGGGLIRIVLRPAYETDNDVLRALSPALDRALDSALARPGMRYAATDQDAADALEQTPGTIATSTLSLVLAEKRQVGILALDGVLPSVETLRNGRYPYHKSLFMVTRSRPSPSVLALMSFITSPAGQRILLANGQLPVNP